MKKIFMLAGLVLAFSVTSVSAQTNTPQINKREKNQKQRIARGLYSGKLTLKETDKLLEQQRSIRRFERRAKSDGKVTFIERLRLYGKLNRASRNIRNKKNN